MYQEIIMKVILNLKNFMHTILICGKDFIMRIIFVFFYLIITTGNSPRDRETTK